MTSTMKASRTTAAAKGPQANPTRAALYYVASDFNTGANPQLMGRHVASEEFAKAWARYSTADRLYCLTQTKEGFKDFAERIASVSPQRREVAFIPETQPNALSDAGLLMLPGPGLTQHAWLRRRFGQRAYSLCGVTHTIASDRIMDAIGQYLIAPVQPWDAVICTSQVVRDTIEHVLVNWSEYLATAFKAKPIKPQLKLPVIPLGIHCDDFAATPERKAAGGMWRSRLRIDMDDIAVLFVGRLAAHAKAHPLPMFAALEKTAKATRKRIHIILAGWFPNKAIEDAFMQAAQVYCPSVKVHVVDGRSGDVRRNIWHASDIFCSLSDNIQETFGLTPIEAMAAGLPVVVTDWNGYRENVRDAQDGLRIPTLTQAPGRGGDISFRYEAGSDNYDLYCANASQSTSVDIEGTAKAFTALVTNEDMRRKMGEAGRQRAREVFDWSVIIPQYEALWAELTELRQNAPEHAVREPHMPSNPLRDDPFTLFAPYPTLALRQDMIVKPKPGIKTADYRRHRDLGINRYGFLAEMEDGEAILDALLHQDNVSVAEITATFPPGMQFLVERTLIWMAKVGLVSIDGHNG